MARWLVKLEGDPYDLEDFPHWFPRGSVFSVSDADGTYVTGKVLEACIDAAAVYEKAQTEVDEMHAAICLFEPNVRRPTIGAVLREDDSGRRTGTVFASASIGSRSKLRGTLSVDGDGNSPPSETQAQILLKAAQSDRHLRIALSLLAMPHLNWPHLYRALEEIEASLKMKVHEANICNSHERDCFTRSANCGEVAAFDSRHRVGKFEPPTHPMTLHRAKAFIRLCLDTALRKIANAE